MRPINAVVLSSLLLAATSASAAGIKVSSDALKAGQTLGDAQVFNGMGCAGSNLSPDLKWGDAPKGTKAFAVTAYDPDAPTGSGWWHWVVFNIPPDTTALPAGIQNGTGLPTGAIESRTDFGKPGYGGACPPTGDKAHRYIFRVVALKDTIPLDKDASAAMVGFYINQMKLAEGHIEAKYARK